MHACNIKAVGINCLQYMLITIISENREYYTQNIPTIRYTYLN